jgi:hypothetical protein
MNHAKPLHRFRIYFCPLCLTYPLQSDILELDGITLSHAALPGRVFYWSLVNNQPGMDIKDQKRRGEWAELRFLARATDLGMTVIRPWGDSFHYDMVVEWEGSLLRVQVKSTIRRRCNSYYFTLRGAIRRYTRDDFDFLAAYLIPEDTWYIIPSEVALTNINQICITPGSSTSRYEPYREAWPLLKEKCYAANASIEHACFRCDCSKRMARRPPSTTPVEPLR